MSLAVSSSWWQLQRTQSISNFLMCSQNSREKHEVNICFRWGKTQAVMYLWPDSVAWLHSMLSLNSPTKGKGMPRLRITSEKYLSMALHFQFQFKEGYYTVRQNFYINNSNKWSRVQNRMSHRSTKTKYKTPIVPYEIPQFISFIQPTLELKQKLKVTKLSDSWI